MELCVFVAAHKDYDFPEDPVYRPIHVGRRTAAVKLPFPGDDTGDNISDQNATYCELTGLYWAWKNTDCPAYGLVHYRRYFAGESGAVATGAELEHMLGAADVVLARRRHYVVQTVRQQYGYAHHAADLDAARAAVMAVSPDYGDAFDKVMNARSLSLYNMFLMRRDLMAEYCEWLFAVLERARQDIPIDTYGPQQRRVLGYLGERLLNVWVVAQPSLVVRRQPVVEIEKRSTLTAGVRMLGRAVGYGRAE